MGFFLFLLICAILYFIFKSPFQDPPVNDGFGDQNTFDLIYISQYGEYTNRRFKAFRLIDCKILQGYCYLRKEERDLRIGNIQNIEVIESLLKKHIEELSNNFLKGTNRYCHLSTHTGHDDLLVTPFEITKKGLSVWVYNWGGIYTFYPRNIEKIIHFRHSEKNYTDFVKSQFDTLVRSAKGESFSSAFSKENEIALWIRGEEDYLVHFIREDKNLTVTCTCGRGSKGWLCKHKTELVEGNFTKVVGGVEFKEDLKKLLSETDVESSYNEYLNDPTVKNRDLFKEALKD
ncbi:MAG: hypothetical protein HEQ32_01995 [Vampirovibrio sp.]